MGFKSKVLNALKNFGGCMGTPKTDHHKNEAMKKPDPPRDRDHDQEEADQAIEAAKDGVNYCKNINSSVGDGGNFVASVNGNQANIVDYFFMDHHDQIEEKDDDEVSIRREKPSRDEDGLHDEIHDEIKEVLKTDISEEKTKIREQIN